ncbi:hypothetical protein AGMMS4956_11790 [Bacteroidia bacterium]|nr:hypothetical protein AGMMS4956_11790 [Bacteroidia bacterium]
MKRITYIFTALVAAALIVMGACQKEIINYNDGYDDGLTPAGPPEIEYIIMAVDTAQKPAHIESADMGAIIEIHGKNLSQVKSITFNGLEADPREWYATNPFVAVRIPRALLDEDKITDKVVVTTSKGQAEATMKIAAPKLIVTGFYNDFAEPGDTVQLLGSNFDLYEFGEGGEVKWEATEELLSIVEVNTEYLRVVLPAAVPTDERSIFSVTSTIYQEKVSTTPVRVALRDAGLVAQNYEGTWGTDFSTTGTNAGDPKPFSGLTKYTRVATEYDAYKWDWILGTGYNLNLNDPDWDMKNHPEQYQIKMEVNSTGAIPSVVTLIFEGSAEGDGHRFSWKPNFDTGKKWRTVTFEVTTFQNAGWDFSKEKSTDYSGFAIAIQPSAAVAVDFSIANARFVKKLE